MRGSWRRELLFDACGIGAGAGLIMVFVAVALRWLPHEDNLVILILEFGLAGFIFLFGIERLISDLKRILKERKGK